ncbi:MAG: hypothetical protein ACTSRA_18335, partial [Promethearchaeota archaeon]
VISVVASRGSSASACSAWISRTCMFVVLKALLTKDLQLKFISLLFLALISLEIGDDSLYLKPTYFFG